MSRGLCCQAPIEHANGLFEKRIELKSMHAKRDRVIFIIVIVMTAVLTAVPAAIGAVAYISPSTMAPSVAPASPPSFLAPTPSKPKDDSNPFGITMGILAAFYFAILSSLCYMLATRSGVYAIGLAEQTKTIAIYTGLKRIGHRKVFRVSEIIAADAVINSESTVKITHELKRKSLRFGVNAEIYPLAVEGEHSIVKQLGQFMRQCGENVADTDTGFRCPERCASSTPARGELPPLADPLISRFPIRSTNATRVIKLSRWYAVVVTVALALLMIGMLIFTGTRPYPEADESTTPSPSTAPLPPMSTPLSRSANMITVGVTLGVGIVFMAPTMFYICCWIMPQYAYGLDRRTWTFTVYSGLFRFNHSTVLFRANEMKAVEKRAAVNELGHTVAITHTKPTTNGRTNPSVLQPVDNVDEFIEEIEAFMLEYKTGAQHTTL